MLEIMNSSFRLHQLCLNTCFVNMESLYLLFLSVKEVIKPAWQCHSENKKSIFKLVVELKK